MVFVKLAIESHWVNDPKRDQVPGHVVIRPAGFLLYSPARAAISLILDGG